MRAVLARSAKIGYSDKVTFRCKCTNVGFGEAGQKKWFLERPGSQYLYLVSVLWLWVPVPFDHSSVFNAPTNSQLQVGANVSFGLFLRETSLSNLLWGYRFRYHTQKFLWFACLHQCHSLEH